MVNTEVHCGATVLYKEEWRSGYDDEIAKIWPAPAVHRCFELGDKGIKTSVT